MLQRAVAIWNPLRLLCLNNKITTLISDKKDKPSSYIILFEDDLLKEILSIIEILEKLEKFTNLVQKEKNPSILDALLIYNRLFTFLNQKSKPSMDEFLKKMAEKLEKVNFLKY